MSIIVTGIKTQINEDINNSLSMTIKRLKLDSSEIKDSYIIKTSIDARKQNEIKLVHSVAVELVDESREKYIVDTLNDSTIKHRQSYDMKLRTGDAPLLKSPVIVGFGPSGMFAGLLLARYGYKPIIIERGSDVDKRVLAVESFWQGKELDTETNVQFGEGGAGTFSDGKLTTRINDERCEFVLKELVAHGSPNDILKKAKPHIGTDKLRGVVKSIREEIISLGGQVRFDEKLIDITIENGKIKSIKTTKDEIETEILITAIGHSARDTFEMLHNNTVVLEAKAFSVGVRIEHLQDDIDTALYGKLVGHKSLTAGEYQLSHRKNDQAVYTFCMCPGGTVVPSSSEENSVVTNGMSEYARDRANANSAVAVSVDKNDFGSDWDSGIKFQRKLEQTAFKLGGSNYKAPAQTIDCFMDNKVGLNLNRISPSYQIGVIPCNFNEVFPEKISSMLKIGLGEFSKKMRGFSISDAILTGVETRTSSPVRMIRNDELQAVGVKGLYPCGEGAGYAGGIMSACVDGIKIAQIIISSYKNLK